MICGSSAEDLFVRVWGGLWCVVVVVRKNTSYRQLSWWMVVVNNATGANQQVTNPTTACNKCGRLPRSPVGGGVAVEWWSWL